MLNALSENARRCGACEGGAEGRRAAAASLWERFCDQAPTQTRNDSAWPRRRCAHLGALRSCHKDGPPVGRARGRAQQEPMRYSTGGACPGRKQRGLNGRVLSLQRGDATEPSAFLVRTMPRGVQARARYECKGRPPPNANMDLYVFENSRTPGEYKIGKSTEVRQRARGLQRSQSFSIYTA